MAQKMQEKNIEIKEELNYEGDFFITNQANICNEEFSFKDLVDQIEM